MHAMSGLAATATIRTIAANCEARCNMTILSRFASVRLFSTGCLLHHGTAAGDNS